ncbi:MAG: murein L,D-transpeptidase family protein [Methylovirgula sp.]
MRFQSGLHAGGQGAVSKASGAGRMRQYGALAAAILFAALLAGCGETPGDFGERAYHPLSPQMLALMQEKGTTKEAPVLIRAFKKEAEVQIWKMKADGHYTLLKSYPICRWSGQLGPKTREGDRQVPEGFYTITPAQMNPRSNYYLSFNVGYPNTYDRAHGYSGGEIMVHGVCSSAGCFSMTDQQIAEIYAIAREAFAGGQSAIQMESFPFHMTAENLAKYRLDPNIGFWKELKLGNDNFEVTGQEVAVGVCNDHYVFNAKPKDGSSFDPTGPCPPLKRDEAVALEVAAKQASDEAKVAALVAAGARPVHTVYADGGQNPRFASFRADVSRPEALAAGPVDVPLDQSRKYRPPTLAQLEAAKLRAETAATNAERKAEAARAFAYADPTQPVPQAAPQTTPGSNQAAAPPQVASPTAPLGFSMAGLGRLWTAQAPAQPAPPPAADKAQEPHDVPLPPRRMEARVIMPQTGAAQTSAKTDPAKPVQSQTAQPASAQASADEAKAAYAKPLPGDMSLLPQGFSAFSAGDH